MATVSQLHRRRVGISEGWDLGGLGGKAAGQQLVPSNPWSLPCPGRSQNELGVSSVFCFVKLKGIAVVLRSPQQLLTRSFKPPGPLGGGGTPSPCPEQDRSQAPRAGGWWGAGLGAGPTGWGARLLKDTEWPLLGQALDTAAPLGSRRWAEGPSRGRSRWPCSLSEQSISAPRAGAPGVFPGVGGMELGYSVCEGQWPVW